MPTRKTKNTNLIEEGVERTREALSQLTDEFEHLQKNAEKRRKQFEKNTERRIKQFQTELRKNSWVKEAQKQRKALERRAEKLRKEIEASEPVKRANELRSDATKLIETQVEGLLENMRIASHTEVTRLERKVAALQRKVTALEKKKPAPRRRAA